MALFVVACAEYTTLACQVAEEEEEEGGGGEKKEKGGGVKEGKG